MIVFLSGCFDSGEQTKVIAHTGSSERLPKGALPRPDHVVIVVEENEDGAQIIGNAEAPFLNRLASEGVSFRNSYGVAHPSQPNYLALFSGSTQGVTSNGCDHAFTGPNLASELEKAGLSFVTYSQSLPHMGFTGCRSGAYERKHNPAVNWQGSNVAPEQNRPFSDFPENFEELPTISLVIPNQDYDMHDGTLEAADQWLEKNLGRYARWASRHNSLLIVTWDEDDHDHNNHIATIAFGAMVNPGESSQLIDHHNVLRTLEEMYQLPLLGESRDAAPITDIWSKVESDRSDG